MGSMGKAPGQGDRGAKPLEAEELLAFGCSMKTANLHTFLQFGNAKKSDICVIFAKNSGWPQNRLEQNWGACAPPGPDLKPPLDDNIKKIPVLLVANRDNFFLILIFFYHDMYCYIKTHKNKLTC